MTTYSAIANSEIAVGAPITNSLMTKVRDNPLAIQEHDGTAPTIAYATAAGTIAGQGDLATKDTVSTTEIDNLAVTQQKLAADLSPWVEIAQVDVGSGTSVTLDGMSATYDAYKIIISDVQRAGSALPLLMRVRIGSVTQTGSGYITNGGASTTSIGMGSISNIATDSGQYEILITAPSNTAIYKPIRITGVQGTDCTAIDVAARYEGSAAAINGVYFYPTSGPFQGGLFTLYGLKT